jgi:hypothetical protein
MPIIKEYYKKIILMDFAVQKLLFTKIFNINNVVFQKRN